MRLTKQAKECARLRSAGRGASSSAAATASGRGAATLRHDFETRVASSLYWKLRAATRQSDSSNGAEAQGQLGSTTKELEMQQPVRLVSPLGLERQLNMAQLAACIVEAAESLEGHDRECLGETLITNAGVIYIASAVLLWRRASAGAGSCNICGAVLAGDTALWWHQKTAHGANHSDAKLQAAVALNSASMALIPLPPSISSCWNRENDVKADAAVDSKRSQADLALGLAAARSGDGGETLARLAAEGRVARLTPGLEAARAGDLALLKKLVREGEFDPTSRDKHGANALMWAAGGGHLEVCRWLTTSREHDGGGLDPSCTQTGRRGYNGRTALHWASRNGHVHIMDWLLADPPAGCGIVVDVATADGTTALNWAAWQGQVEAVELLLRHGADVTAVNTYGCDCALWACQSPAEPERVLAVCHLLASPGDGGLGLNFDRVNNNGHSCMHKAAQRGNRSVCEWLVERSECAAAAGRLPVPLRAEHVKADWEGHTPSQLARLEGFESLADWLQDRAEPLALDASRGGA
eukprot:TRINITY_DN31266_c0_g1_i1.p1 TRINITY_DN31266_c0_g1~~TRINITY_DN31266_c0_g1_i1.p1  ORF type:complete len:527 (+),score=94.28 TRINITY_DN31266_c0_g1_i1:221-1801(+)